MRSGAGGADILPSLCLLPGGITMMTVAATIATTASAITIIGQLRHTLLGRAIGTERAVVRGGRIGCDSSCFATITGTAVATAWPLLPFAVLAPRRAGRAL